MFHDLDSTLAKVLDDTAAQAELRAADVSFETPRGTYAPSVATVNLFLYQVKENRELRDPTMDIELVNGEYVSHVPALRTDCAYLITTWSGANGPARVVEEHRLLGQALWWLSRFPTIPDTYLQGSLSTQPLPPPTMVAQLDGERSLSEFWTALGTPPRPAFHLTATLALDLGVESPEGPPVATVEVTLKRRAPRGEPEPILAHWLTIAGTVRDANTHAGLLGAVVSLLHNGVPLGLLTQTDVEGQFRLSPLSPGQYTLRVTAPGYAQHDTPPITLPAATRPDYDVSLTP